MNSMIRLFSVGMIALAQVTVLFVFGALVFDVKGLSRLL